jgi:hypothetical protein
MLNKTPKENMICCLKALEKACYYIYEHEVDLTTYEDYDTVTVSLNGGQVSTEKLIEELNEDDNYLMKMLHKIMKEEELV